LKTPCRPGKNDPPVKPADSGSEVTARTELSKKKKELIAARSSENKRTIKNSRPKRQGKNNGLRRSVQKTYLPRKQAWCKM